jgi:hypothetical protein
MALPGNAFLAIWHDIDADAQNEYMEWHTREHMPERLALPGFLVGKRLINHAVARYRYGTIYAGSEAEVFRSTAYLERLNNPTAWSDRVQPAFRNFLRVACDRVASAGQGEGGALATIRLDLPDQTGQPGLMEGAQPLVEQLLAVRAACCVHLGVARDEISSIKTRETELRPVMHERAFDALILVEGSGLPELLASIGKFEKIIDDAGLGLSNPQTIVYNLAYQLSGSD